MPARIFLFAIVAVAFAIRFPFLLSFDTPTGIDGYYYAIQLRSLLERGALWFPTEPLAFWLLYPFAALTDPILGTKIGSAFYGALLPIPFFFAGRKLGKSDTAGLIPALLVATSAGAFYLGIEFVKCQIGMLVAATAIAIILSCENRPRSIKVSVFGGCLAIALLTHKLAAVIVFTVGAATFGWVWLFIPAIAVASVSDLIALGAPTWTLPAVVVEGRPVWLGFEAHIGALLAVVATIQFRRLNVFAAMALAIACPFLVVDDPDGLTMRLRAVAFFPEALLAAIIVGLWGRIAVCCFMAWALLLQPRDRNTGLIVPAERMIAASQHPDAPLFAKSRIQKFLVIWSAPERVLR